MRVLDSAIINDHLCPLVYLPRICLICYGLFIHDTFLATNTNKGTIYFPYCGLSASRKIGKLNFQRTMEGISYLFPLYYSQIYIYPRTAA